MINLVQFGIVFLAVALLATSNNLSTVQAIWPFDHVNSSDGYNKTGNQTVNQTLTAQSPQAHVFNTP